MNHRQTLVLLVLIFISLPVQAVTTPELLKDCNLYQKAIDSEEKNSELTLAKSSGCHRYLDGFKHGVLFNNIRQMAYAKAQDAKQYYSCKVEAGTFNLKALKALTRYVERHPVSLDWSAATTLTAAMTPLVKCAHQKVGIHYPY